MSNSPSSNSRLNFIDVGRSLAIILMLQGHFISMTFEDYTTMTADLRSHGTSGNLFFDFWCYLRGYTAPLFFTITGVVFAYLLMKNQDGPFWKRKRVKKGVIRGFSIIGWGYFLQLSIVHIPIYSSGRMNDRFYMFHVLQSIGLAILMLITLYWICNKIKKIPYEAYLIFFGTTAFVIAPIINNGSGEYFPAHAPRIIQNMFYGPHSVFPIFPWFGFVFFGGAIGVLIHKYQYMIGRKRFPLRATLIGIAACLSGHSLIIIAGSLFPNNAYVGVGQWQFVQLALIILVLGILMGLEQVSKFKIPFLVAIGQNTLAVYIIHVIVLYGAVFGWGVKTYFNKSLSAGEAAFGAILFVIVFGLLTKYQSRIVALLKAPFTRTKSVN